MVIGRPKSGSENESNERVLVLVVNRPKESLSGLPNLECASVSVCPNPSVKPSSVFF